MLRLQQLLAEVGYLPLNFRGIRSNATLSSLATVASTKQVSHVARPATLARVAQGRPAAVAIPASARTLSRPTTRLSTPAATLKREATTPGAVGLLPEAGSFSWRYPDIPSSLAASWQPGVDTALVRGAVMAFESAHGIPADGDAGPEVWTALLNAVAQRRVSNAPYSYIEVATTNPETLRVWTDGKIIYQSLANTGIAVEPTAPGTFPVYLRYASTTMRGYNPNGSYYDDPGVPYVAYFNGGDAVHGFLRAKYGYPQSLGCVELPYANAAVVFNYDQIGTLVNVA